MDPLNNSNHITAPAWFGEFSDVTKGQLLFLDQCVEWVLGEVKLCIYGDGEEFLVLVKYRLKHWHEVTHLHLDDTDLPELIKDINSPQNVICIKRDLFGLLGTSFAVIEKGKKKRTRRWRYYSE